MHKPVMITTIGASLTLLAAYSNPSSSQTNQDLRTQLNIIVSEGHQRIGYGATYNVLAKLHQDPANPSNVILFYTNRSQNKDLRVNNDRHNGWNREHLWPQSKGARREPMKSDLHHLMPTDATVNSSRGSLDFDNGGSPDSEAPDTFRDSDSLEPRDDIKGNIARALFYMDVRYEGNNGEPDLVLKTGNTRRGSALGRLCTLIQWHQDDPVDTAEKARNDTIKKIQGNTNIFIEKPNLALTLYGSRCSQTPPAPLTNLHSPNDGTPTPQATKSLRLAAWNIANLWHVEGEHLRPRRDGSAGLRRTAADYDAIRRVADDLNADIIGLQEMGTPDAVRKIFPEDKFDLVFSRRLADDLASDPDKLNHDTRRDIYTALVVRRDKARIIGTERLELDILHEDGRPVREGTAALIAAGDTKIWAVSVHLKSGCFTNNDLTERGDCRTLAKQIPILEDWIDRKSAAGESVALLGDFNRQIDRGSDVVRKDLDDQSPVDLFKVPHRQKLPCTAFTSQARISIDYVIMNEKLWEFANVPAIPKLDFSNRRISDHCPVFVDLSLP